MSNLNNLLKDLVVEHVPALDDSSEHKEFTFSTQATCDFCGYEDKTAKILGYKVCSYCHTTWENSLLENIDYSDD